jgi:sensor histidine kinase YesM
MKETIDKRYRFYLWVGLAYLMLWLLIDLSNHPNQFSQYFLNEIWRALYIIPLNYMFFEYTLRKLSTRRILLSIFLIALTLFLMGTGLYIWRSIGIAVGIYTQIKTFPDVSHAISEQFGAGLFSLLFFGVIRHIYHYKRLKLAAQQLRIEKQQAELNYLKSQTNPHFLFNTLNNIYALARDKSDLAPESILRLSKILRFMLYETNGQYIAVEQELKIISDYIALEQLRYDDSLRLNFNHDIEDMKQAIPPLLLIPLVENAFKHGVSETRGLPFIDIHLSIRKRQLEFSVKNSSEKIDEESTVKENIGLSNLRRQLELLYTDSNLTVRQNDSVFTATLKINLGSHV